MIKIMIVEDHPLTRLGIRELIEHEGDMQVVAEANSKEEALEALQDPQINVAILDINLPNDNSFALLEKIVNSYPHIKVLMLSIYPEEQFAMRALRLGAMGYLNKEADPKEVVRAIKRVIDGKKYISEDLASRMLEKGQTESNLPHERLSDREFQVMRMIGGGMSARKIADSLHISEKTVATYRARVFQKMGFENSAELINYCIRNKLLA